MTTSDNPSPVMSPHAAIALPNIEPTPDRRWKLIRRSATHRVLLPLSSRIAPKSVTATRS